MVFFVVIVDNDNDQCQVCYKNVSSRGRGKYMFVLKSLSLIVSRHLPIVVEVLTCVI